MTAKRIEITEVGLRDGLQAEPQIVPVDTKIALARDLIKAGVRSFELSSFVSPKAVPQLADASELFAAILAENDGLDLSALVANEKGLERAIEAGVPAVVMFISASESHNQKNINSTREASLARFRDMAKKALDASVDVHCSIATSFTCPFEGEVPAQDVADIARAMQDMGTTRIKLGDTIGTATPPAVTERVEAVRKSAPDVELVLHFHNTRGIGLVNAWHGLSLGVTRFESSVGGLGGCPFVPRATGNISTEDFAYLLHETGYETGLDIDAISAIAERAGEAVGHDLPGLYMKAGPRLRTWPMDAARTATGR